MIEPKIYEKDRELFNALKAMPEDVRRQIGVGNIPFNARALNVFHRMGVKTLGQLQSKSRFDLMREQGMGELSYSQIVFFMQELGLPMPVVSTAAVTEEPTHNLRELVAQLRDVVTKMEEALR